ncbi:hypothetical protein K0B96_06670 [Horticoccus luteus]|uniref:Uncharacterized protein n=1 Tax=Horticoccus luteus TaxID=2862869 RepID=A0A8F9TY02_9BACT|nr:hypothetical protein [Horticoccus luteus]QYM80293.1 hypothetical protein K0B96_06670 [Horticoccus luteus]
MRRAERQAEARAALAQLHAARQAIPASLSDKSEQQRPFALYETSLIAQANGTSAKPKRRWAPSQKRRPQPGPNGGAHGPEKAQTVTSASSSTSRPTIITPTP